ncbi:MAG: chorismate synthase [Elusimicrobiales bacterium]
MNYLTAGESHSKYIMAILNGFPQGLKIDEEYISKNLKKRRELPGRSKRQEVEKDEFEIISGLSNGKTTGMPIGIIIKNNKNERYPNNFIPLHGERYGAIKYLNKDYASYRERLSQRETAARVSIFSFPRKMLEELGIKIHSGVTSCYGEKKAREFKKIIERFKIEGDSFGGVFEVRIKNLVPGIGGFAQGLDRLQSKLSNMLFSIGSIKGVEFGAGFNIERYTTTQILKKPQLLGGIEGGVSRGDDIVIRCVTRPLAAARRISTESTSDITSVFTAAFISEFLVAYVIADEIISKFGSDVFDEIKDAYKRYLKRI